MSSREKGDEGWQFGVRVSVVQSGGAHTWSITVDQSLTDKSPVTGLKANGQSCHQISLSRHTACECAVTQLPAWHISRLSHRNAHRDKLDPICFGNVIFRQLGEVFSEPWIVCLNPHRPISAIRHQVTAQHIHKYMSERSHHVAIFSITEQLCREVYLLLTQ